MTINTPSLPVPKNHVPQIVVVGSFVVGLTIRTPRLPVLGENLVGQDFDLGPGGKGTNQAIAAARLGAMVTLLACLGDDMFAQIALDLYRLEGIDPTHIHHIAGAHTGVGFVTLLPSGENMIVVDPGANLSMTPVHVDALRPEFGRADIVMLQLEVPDPVVEHTLKLSQEAGVRTLLNPAPGRRLDQAWLPMIDVLTPNESELRLLVGLPPDDPTPTEELAQLLHSQGARHIVVTRGARGALVVSAHGCTAIPTPYVQPVDVTGAGDSFNAALAVGLACGQSLIDAVQDGVYAGAYATLHLGVINGLPTTVQLTNFRAAHSLP